MSFLAIWLPPLIWMAAIMTFSRGEFNAEETASWFRPLLRWLLPWATAAQIEALHTLARAAAHFTEYAILAALWFRAFVRGPGLTARRASWPAFLLAVAWAFLDEWHQATLLERTGSARDVVLDASGALAALALARAGWRRLADVATEILLWIAAAGGAALIGVNLLAGVPSAVLWLTAPAAALALIVRWRRRASRS